ncbi:MAG: iron ABC transporter permease [Alphaproteobacteria bacterium]
MKKSSIYGVLISFLVVLFLLSLAIGSLPFSTCLENFSLCQMVIQELRLPRTLLALIGGATLGLTGATLQGFLRNPLADPGILGISSGAAFGAICPLVFGIGSFSLYIVPLSGMLGSGLVVSILLAMNRWSSKNSAHTILGGIILNSLFGALTILVLNLSKDPYVHMETIFWMLGSLSHHTYGQILLLLPFTGLGWIILWKFRYALDAFSFGEDMAYTLGFKSSEVYKYIVLGLALCIGPLVSLVGIIGFIGLVVPHILRPFVGYKPSTLLLPSALGGACLVLMADLLVRLIPTGIEMKVGVITSLIGAPFFIYVLLQSHKKNHDLF